MTADDNYDEQPPPMRPKSAASDKRSKLDLNEPEEEEEVEQILDEGMAEEENIQEPTVAEEPFEEVQKTRKRKPRKE